MKNHSTNIGNSNFFSAKKPSHFLETKNVIGIGVGPFNLSLAALLDPVHSISSIFFDKQAEFIWHQGLLFTDAELQVHYLKDLVSLVDPTSPYSFLNFLIKKKRLYHFITADFNRVSRQEFNQYFQWACQKLPNIKFNSNVKEVRLHNDNLCVHVETPKNNIQLLTTTIVMGIGLQPYIPHFAKKHLGRHVFHATNFLHSNVNFTGKKVAVIGGGQTGAEIVKHLIKKYSGSISNLYWLSKRDNFLPIDESPFVNDLFTPAHSNYFYNQSGDKKKRLLIKHRLFSDGISPNILKEIYQEIYRLQFLANRSLVCSLIPGVELVDMQQQFNSWELALQHQEQEKPLPITADIVIFATGYRYQIPAFLAELQNNLAKDEHGQLLVNNDFSLQWNGPQNCRLYIQNGASHSHGIADPNLSLMAWRSATIINSLTGRTIYSIENQKPFVDWAANAPTKQHKNNENHLVINLPNLGGG